MEKDAMILQAGEKLQDTDDDDDDDDTVVLDGPLAETQMEKLGFDTEELVLDSEDDEEGIRQHQSENTRNGLSIRNAVVRRDLDTGLLNVENTDERNDHAQLRECDQGLVRLNYVGSEEPGESSEATALGFVDQFLSLSGMNLSPRTAPRNTVRKILSPVLSARGSQRLAKLVKTRTPVGKNGTFDWVNEDQYEGYKRMDECFDFADCHQSSVTKHQPAGHADSKEGCSLNNECEDKSAKEICSAEVEQVSEMPLENQLEIHGTETHITDWFDVGFNTQIAAEAMEALFCGPAADCSACDAYQDPHVSLVASSKVVKNIDFHLNEPSHEKGALCNLEDVTSVPKQRKSRSRKVASGSSWKQTSHPELSETTKRKRSKPLVKELTGRSVICANECSAGMPPRAGCKFKRTCDGSDDIMAENIIKYTRKRSRSAPKPSEVLNAVNASEEAKKKELSQQKLDSLEAYGPKSSLNAWSCPKGKRTHRKLPSHSNGANNKCTMFKTFDSKESQRKPVNKKLPRSSLLKEPSRLGAHESKPDFGWRDLRKRREMAYVRVLFSQHLENDVIKQQKKILVRLGMTTASCLMEATHFIANRFMRTRNMLEAISLGKPVVTHLWLESCGQASCLIDEKNYILRDVKKEKEIGFSLPVSLACAKQHPLLKGQRVFITPNVKPDKETITSLVNAAHGLAVEKRQISSLDDLDDLLILSCEEDHEMCASLLDKGAAIYSSELLLNGIVIQKLEYKRHRLFVSQVKGNRPRKR